MSSVVSTPAADNDEARRARWWALVLALGTLALFAPVRNFAFVDFDDDAFVYANDMVRQGFTWAGIKWAFLSADIDYWRPLSWLSHMLDVELFGLRAGGHHLTNAVIHAANAVLLFFALRRLTRRLMPSLIVAVLFAWHPLHVESVAWVAERKDVLCALFWFFGLWCYADYAESPSRRRFGTVAVCLSLGLMSKPMIITFPFLLLLLDVWPLRRLEFQGDWRGFARSLNSLVKEKIPLFALVLLAAIATFAAQRSVGAIMPEELHSFPARLANIPVAYARYLGLTAWPVNLAILYPIPSAWPAWQVAGALALLTGLTWGCVRRLGQQPWLAVGWFWFLGTLVPVIGVIQVGSQSIANRYTYVPLVGVFIALVWWLDEVRAQRGGWARGLAVLAVAVLALCMARTRWELWHWRDGTAIFDRAVHVTKDNFVAMGSLAKNLMRVDKQAATELYRRAWRIRPDNANTLYNYATALTQAGQQQTAIKLYQEALRIRPDSAETHYNLASSLAETREPQAAERHYREALRLHPGHARAHNNLANLLSDTGRVPEAIQHYEESLRLSPGNLEARFNYGITLADLGRTVEAIAQFEEAVKIRPAFTRARLQLVSLHAALGKAGEAAAHNAELLRHDPASPEGHFNAGSLASARGDWNATLAHWQEAIRVKPDFLPALHRLAWTLATHPNATVRNPRSALELAGQFATRAGAQSAEALDLLAVAHAANGAFEPAMRHAQQALATVGTNTALAVEIRARLALFQIGKPFLDSPAK